MYFVLTQGRSIHTYDMLVEAKEICNPLQNPDHVYNTLDNKLVYVSGRLATTEVWYAPLEMVAPVLILAT